MAKVSGITMTVTVQNSSGVAKNISNDITSISFGTTRGVQDITGLDKSAMERLLLLADGKVDITGIFNSEADKSHDVFKTVVSSTAAREVVITLPGPITLTLTVVFENYDLSRSQDGSLVWKATGSLSSGTAPVWA